MFNSVTPGSLRLRSIESRTVSSRRWATVSRHSKHWIFQIKSFRPPFFSKFNFGDHKFFRWFTLKKRSLKAAITEPPLSYEALNWKPAWKGFKLRDNRLCWLRAIALRSNGFNSSNRLTQTKFEFVLQIEVRSVVNAVAKWNSAKVSLNALIPWPE